MFVGLVVAGTVVGIIVLLVALFIQRGREGLDLSPRGLLRAYLYAGSFAGLVALVFGLAAIGNFVLASAVGNDVVYGAPPVPRPAIAPACPPNIPNCPPSNLVQLGIGGWQVPRAGVKVGRERGTTILTVNDIEKIGIDKTIEIALEVAWKGASAVYMSFDIDSLDAGFVPGTGWPEPGGLLPREALKLVAISFTKDVNRLSCCAS